MAQAQRNDIDLGDPLALPAGGVPRYDAGGHVAELQADLVRRLTGNGTIAPAAMAVTPLEQLVRACSAAGGYAALVAGYAAVGFVVARWM